MTAEISMYRASVPVFDRMLGNLDAILAKAAAWAEAKKIDPVTVANLRLVADMFPLSRQVQIACDHAKGGPGRLAQVELPKFEDKEKDIAELRARIAGTRAYIATLKPEQFAGSEQRALTIKFGPREVHFENGVTYLADFVLPNFYFHVTTVYAILRANGLDVGKKDFIGA